MHFSCGSEFIRDVRNAEITRAQKNAALIAAFFCVRWLWGLPTKRVGV